MSSWLSKFLGTNTPAGQTPYEQLQRSIQQQTSAYESQNALEQKRQQEEEANRQQLTNTMLAREQTEKQDAEKALGFREAQLGRQYQNQRLQGLMRQGISSTSPLAQGIMSESRTQQDRSTDEARGQTAKEKYGISQYYSGQLGNLRYNYRNPTSSNYDYGAGYYSQQQNPGLWSYLQPFAEMAGKKLIGS
jgi:hypothetical protein